MRFINFILCFIALSFGSFTFVATQNFFQTLGVVFDDAICDIQNRTGRAIVFFQFDHRRVFVVVLETKQDFEISFSPRINWLVHITNDHQRSLFPIVAVIDFHMRGRTSDHADQIGLRFIGILKFVNQNMAESIAQASQHVRIGLHQFSKDQNQIIEIECIIASEIRLKGRIYFG